MPPASQEYRRINESLLGKLLELLGWNKQHHIFNSVGSVALFKKGISVHYSVASDLCKAENGKLFPLQTSFSVFTALLPYHMEGKGLALRAAVDMGVRSHTYVLKHTCSSSADKMLYARSQEIISE